MKSQEKFKQKEDKFFNALEDSLNKCDIYKLVNTADHSAFTLATFYGAYNLIRPPTDKNRFRFLSEFDDEQLLPMGFVRIKETQRIVLQDSSEATQWELGSLIKALQQLNPHTHSLLSALNIPTTDIDKFRNTCAEILTNCKGTGGRTVDKREEDIIRVLSKFYAQFTHRRPASRGLTSYFIKYVHACYSATSPYTSVETIESKIKTYNKRHPFKATFAEDGTLLP